jgi:hypothetical protein
MFVTGKKILETKNPKILKLYNRPTDIMCIIINHGLQEGYNGVVEESKMIIKSVKVFQK